MNTEGTEAFSHISGSSVKSNFQEKRSSLASYKPCPDGERQGDDHEEGAGGVHRVTQGKGLCDTKTTCRAVLGIIIIITVCSVFIVLSNINTQVQRIQIYEISERKCIVS